MLRMRRIFGPNLAFVGAADESMFGIKICGVTRDQDVAACIAAGADALGWNFFPASPRAVTPSIAARLADAADAVDPAGRVARVGVFVNASAKSISEAVVLARLTWVQLHGDEPPSAIDEIAAICGATVRVIKALRLNPGEGGMLAQHLEAARAAGRAPDALLVDAAAAGAYGGTGRQAPWGELAAIRSELAGVPLLLAGGLRHDNVAEAIAIVCPDGVDTASGVESSPGVKDAELVNKFILTAQRAFARASQPRPNNRLA